MSAEPLSLVTSIRQLVENKNRNSKIAKKRECSYAHQLEITIYVELPINTYASSELEKLAYMELPQPSTFSMKQYGKVMTFEFSCLIVTLFSTTLTRHEYLDKFGNDGEYRYVRIGEYSQAIMSWCPVMSLTAAPIEVNFYRLPTKIALLEQQFYGYYQEWMKAMPVSKMSNTILHYMTQHCYDNSITMEFIKSVAKQITVRMMILGNLRHVVLRNFLQYIEEIVESWDKDRSGVATELNIAYDRKIEDIMAHLSETNIEMQNLSKHAQRTLEKYLHSVMTKPESWHYKKAFECPLKYYSVLLPVQTVLTKYEEQSQELQSAYAYCMNCLMDNLEGIATKTRTNRTSYDPTCSNISIFEDVISTICEIKYASISFCKSTMNHFVLKLEKLSYLSETSERLVSTSRKLLESNGLNGNEIYTCGSIVRSVKTQLYSINSDYDYITNRRHVQKQVKEHQFSEEITPSKVTIMTGKLTGHNVDINIHDKNRWVIASYFDDCALVNNQIVTDGVSSFVSYEWLVSCALNTIVMNPYSPISQKNKHIIANKEKNKYEQQGVKVHILNDSEENAQMVAEYHSNIDLNFLRTIAVSFRTKVIYKYRITEHIGMIRIARIKKLREYQSMADIRSYVELNSMQFNSNVNDSNASNSEIVRLLTETKGKVLPSVSAENRLKELKNSNTILSLETLLEYIYQDYDYGRVIDNERTRIQYISRDLSTYVTVGISELRTLSMKNNSILYYIRIFANSPMFSTKPMIKAIPIRNDLVQVVKIVDTMYVDGLETTTNLGIQLHTTKAEVSAILMISGHKCQSLVYERLASMAETLANLMKTNNISRTMMTYIQQQYRSTLSMDISHTYDKESRINYITYKKSNNDECHNIHLSISQLTERTSSVMT